MTRLESGVLELQRDWIDLRDILGTAVNRLAPPLSQHRLVVDVEPGSRCSGSILS